MNNEDMITVSFELLGDPTTYPVTVNKKGTVNDLIKACGETIGLDPEKFNIRNFQRILIRNANLSFYHIANGDRIIGGRKYEASAAPLQKKEEGNEAESKDKNDDAEKDEDNDDDDDDDDDDEDKDDEDKDEDDGNDMDLDEDKPKKK